jgi:hypothetical protein
MLQQRTLGTGDKTGGLFCCHAHIERDDFEDVLIKKRGDTPNFGLELVSSNVDKVSVKMHKE